MIRIKFILANSKRAEPNAFNLAIDQMSTLDYLPLAETCSFAQQGLPLGKVPYYWDTTEKHTTASQHRASSKDTHKHATYTQT